MEDPLGRDGRFGSDGGACEEGLLLEETDVRRGLDDRPEFLEGMRASSQCRTVTRSARTVWEKGSRDLTWVATLRGRLRPQNDAVWSRRMMPSVMEDRVLTNFEMLAKIGVD